MERQITIREIAERAGVSTATVSNVLHGKTKRVSPATIERVRRIIDDMGYIGAVNGSVGSAGEENRPKLVILVVNSHKKHKDAIGADPFYGKMIGLVEQFLKQRGYYMMLCSASDMDDILRMAMSWQADGVITLTLSKNDSRKIAGLMRCPLVSIDAYGPGTDLPNITLDDRQGGYIMTEYLLQCGYSPIYVCASRDFGGDHLRYEGCQAAVSDASLETVTENSKTAFPQTSSPKTAPNGNRASGLLRPQLRFVPLGMDPERRRASFQELLRPLTADIQKGRRPALFCLSDRYALEALSLCAAQNLKIPEHLGIAGFDDIYCSSVVTPALTTIRQDMRHKAELAVQCLLSLIEQPPSHSSPTACLPPKDILLPVRLIPRASTGPSCPRIP